MTEKQIKDLPNGALIVIEGNGMFGYEHRVCFFQKDENHIWLSKERKHKGYFYLSCLYPFSWVKLATKSDLMLETEKAKEQCEKRISALNKAFEITEKVNK